MPEPTLGRVLTSVPPRGSHSTNDRRPHKVRTQKLTHFQELGSYEDPHWLSALVPCSRARSHTHLHTHTPHHSIITAPTSDREGSLWRTAKPAVDEPWTEIPSQATTQKTSDSAVKANRLVLV